MRGEVYSALPTDISVTDASSELRYVNANNANDELGLENNQPLPKSPTLALEKVRNHIRTHDHIHTHTPHKHTHHTYTHTRYPRALHWRWRRYVPPFHPPTHPPTHPHTHIQTHTHIHIHTYTHTPLPKSPTLALEKVRPPSHTHIHTHSQGKHTFKCSFQ